MDRPITEIRVTVTRQRVTAPPGLVIGKRTQYVRHVTQSSACYLLMLDAI